MKRFFALLTLLTLTTAQGQVYPGYSDLPAQPIPTRPMSPPSPPVYYPPSSPGHYPLPSTIPPVVRLNHRPCEVSIGSEERRVLFSNPRSAFHTVRTGAGCGCYAVTVGTPNYEGRYAFWVDGAAYLNNIHSDRRSASRIGCDIGRDEDNAGCIAMYAYAHGHCQ